MTKLLGKLSILGLFVVTCFSASMSFAQDEVWCAYDDPATWRIERLKLAREGVKDTTKIQCPEKETGAFLPEELALPMPCGRAMMFRRIDVPLPHPMDHLVGNFGRVVDIQQESPIKVLSNGAWSAPVGGAFTLGEDTRGLTTSLESFIGKAYYIAKYEVTEIQWQLLELGAFDPEISEAGRAEICAQHKAQLAEVDPRHVLAKSGLSWFDGIEFSRAYSNWLIAGDKERIRNGSAPVLPWEQGSTGYVRLPTEAEWEYAARGGADGVTPQAQPRTVPPALNEISGELAPAVLADVCADEPNPDRGWLVGGVGRKKPNALKIYDMLCNAEEIVLDLFRPTRPDGLHGQVGGVISKGGNSVSLRDENTVGRRSEAQGLFTARGEGTIVAGGTRMAISAPVFAGRRTEQNDYVEGRGNAIMIEALMDGREQLLSRGLTRGGTAALNREIEELRKRLADGQSSTEDLAQQIELLQSNVDKLTNQLTDRAALSVRTSIRGAVATSLMVDRVGVNLYDAFARLEGLKEREAEGEVDADHAKRIRQVIEPGIARNRQRMQAGFDLYVQLHRELAEESEEFVGQQLAAAKAGASGANVRVFGKFLDFFEIHHREVRQQRGRVTETMLDKWLTDIDSHRRKRIADFRRYELQ